ncbi:MAG: hypothetical protein OEZ04_11260 [Nitrospinota bacterium]|nr:hypothetical protein [Nitrospinota bacterium]
MSSQRVIIIPPARLLVGLFAGLCLAGAGLLMLPAATHNGISFVDALFTATSATCVTGLMTMDVGADFTMFGQLIILGLIQIGGLGIMTFSTFFLVLLGQPLSMRDSSLMAEKFDHSRAMAVRDVLKKVMTLTITLEVAGAIALFITWYPEMGASQAAFYSLFHAVSAFCNAGISLFPGSLSTHATSATVNAVVMILIMAGSLGFLTIVELYTLSTGGGGKRSRMSLNCKLILTVTLALTVISTLFIFAMERHGALAGMSDGEAAMASLFQAVTRTAGFTTVDIEQFSNASLFMYILLMLVGAAPGSVGGGVKVTTFGVLIALAAARLASGDRVHMFGKTIPEEVVSRAYTVVFFSAQFVVAFSMLLFITEAAGQEKFLAILFEAVSAFGTVGLSLGITATLSVYGKILVTLLMLIGRLGPLAVTMAVGGGKSKAEFQYAEESVMVG